jgi:hypothetical protein
MLGSLIWRGFSAGTAGQASWERVLAMPTFESTPEFLKYFIQFILQLIH